MSLVCSKSKSLKITKYLAIVVNLAIKILKTLNWPFLQIQQGLPCDQNLRLNLGIKRWQKRERNLENYKIFEIFKKFHDFSALFVSPQYPD